MTDTPISGKAHATPVVDRSLFNLNQLFAARASTAIAKANAAGYDIYLYEGKRTDETQEIYYALGRTVKPPLETVTNAAHANSSWHLYGLAGDFISKKHEWDVTLDWMKAVAEIFKSCGLDWGGDWHKPDYPHYQMGGIPASPTEEIKELYASQGLQAVWEKLGVTGEF